MSHVSNTPLPVNEKPNKKPRRRKVVLVLDDDLARAVIRNLSSRAAWFTNRREPDPLIKTICQHEAKICERAATAIGNAMQEVAQ